MIFVSANEIFHELRRAGVASLVNMISSTSISAHVAYLGSSHKACDALRELARQFAHRVSEQQNLLE